jgi:hypothetical protein
MTKDFKTILIPIFQGSVAKNILRNDIFKILKNQLNVRVVLLVPNKEKRDYFEAEFFGDNVIYEIFLLPEPSFWDKIFVFLRKNMLVTSAINIKRKDELKTRKNYVWYWSGLVFSKFFAKRFFRRIIRWFDFYFVSDNIYGEMFHKYSPDLVCSGHIFSDVEASLIKIARRKKIKTIGIINSWDKITTRGMARVIPDKLIVHNNIIKEEAIKYLDMEARDIIITGIPHYDVFVNSKPTPREAFYKKIEAKHKDKIILFCPMGSTFSDVDSEIINLICDFKLKKQISEDTHILVRFPPNDKVDLSKLKKSSILSFDYPGKRFSSKRGLDWDMNDGDIQHLFDSLYYCSLVISPPSSICIDAAVFDKPIINIKFRDYGENKRNINKYYKMDHYKNLVATKGIRFVETDLELLIWINKYLTNPGLDRKFRKKIVNDQCWKLDGRSGKRAANFIISYLKM